MIGKLIIVCSLSILCGALSTASAVNRQTCLQGLSATDKPVFAGLTMEKFDIDPSSSSEGAEYQVFSGPSGIPVFILTSEYGETGKKIALYKLLHGSIGSYSARISSYRYLEPIYSGPTRIVQVDTSSFIVCDDVVVNGVGTNGASQSLVVASKEAIAKAIQLFGSKRVK